jgi:hypothetical protein
MPPFSAPVPRARPSAPCPEGSAWSASPATASGGRSGGPRGAWPEDPLTVQDCSTFTATEARRLAVVPKIVSIGVTWQNSLDPSYPDDGVVPIQSALFDGAGPPLKRRYRGEGGLGAKSTCRGNFLPHTAMHEPNCLVAEDPASGRGLEDVFTVVRRELLQTVLELSVNKTTISAGDTLTLSMSNGAESQGVICFSRCGYREDSSTRTMAPVGRSSGMDRNCSSPRCNRCGKVSPSLKGAR